MNLKAIVIYVSDIDQSGNFEVSYDIYNGKEPLYRNLQTIGSNNDQIIEQIKNKLQELITITTEKAKIQIGQEITL